MGEGWGGGGDAEDRSMVKKAPSAGADEGTRNLRRGKGPKATTTDPADPAQLIADLQGQLAECRAERDAGLAREAALAEVLQTTNSSPGDLTPVFDAILAKAHALCGVEHGALITYDGEYFRLAAEHGMPQFWIKQFRQPYRAAPGGPADRLLRGERYGQIADARAAEETLQSRLTIRAGSRTILSVPLRKEGALLGYITAHRREVRLFSDKEIALLESFAAQAVIAMENARLLGELRQRTDELAERNTAFGERIEHQSATIDVLKAMSASPGDPQPVFDLIVRRARDRCNATSASLFEFDGELVHLRSRLGQEAYATPDAMEAYERLFPMVPTRGSITCRAILDRQTIHVRDMASEPGVSAAVRNLGQKSQISLPLLRDGAAIGAIATASGEVGGFTDSQVALLQTFAEQAVIAITGAETYRELQQRTDDLQESLEYQTATSDVLKVISGSTFDIQPVFQTIVETAARLCDADQAAIYRRDGEAALLALNFGFPAEYEAAVAAVGAFPLGPTRPETPLRAMLEGHPVHVHDVAAVPGYSELAIRLGKVRTSLGVPLMREGRAIGSILLARQRVEPFTDRQIELVSAFADQAVIAIENARLLGELQARTDELTRSVGELQALEEVLRAVNSSLDLDTVLATIISRAAQLSRADEGTIYEFDETEEVFVPKSAFGMSAERVAGLRERRVRLGETHLGRAAVERAPVYVDDVQQDPTLSGPDRGGLLEGIHAVLAVPLLREDKVVGGLVIRRRTAVGFAPTIPTLLQTFAGQAVLAIENARLFQELMARGEEARRARTAAEAALADLRRPQPRLIQPKKMPPLGQLTAGIAHEIKTPLNFVNISAALSVELLDELKETAAPAIAGLAEDERADVDEIVGMLTGNLAKIAEHGRRADGIVKSMLEHSRGVSGERREVDLNALVDEALNLAYHGARAQDAGFNITLEREFDPAVAPIELAPQEITRVFLNLIGNGFYAVTRRARGNGEAAYRPILQVSTRDLGDAVEVRVRDNGTGIPPEIRDQLFQPFFTTKPTGEGTGLGLSISYEIVTMQHRGTIEVDSEPGEFTEFTIRLPRNGQ